MNSANMNRDADVNNVDDIKNPAISDKAAINPLNESVAKFNSLNVDDRLAALALIYQQVSGSISADSLGTPASAVSELLRKVEQIPQDDQVRALHDLFTAGGDEEGEVVLNPHPSRALTELVSGSGEQIPVGDYNSLGNEDKLIFWYQAAQRLGSSIVGIPSDFSPSSEVTDFLNNSFKSLDDDQRVKFLKRIV